MLTVEMSKRRNNRRRNGSGLVTPWHLAERCEEECSRAAGYDQPCALLVVEPAPQSNRRLVEEQLLAWLDRGLRRADIVAGLGNARYAVLLPETGSYEASRVAYRLRDAVEQADVYVSSCPQDGANLGDLIVAARGGVSAA